MSDEDKELIPLQSPRPIVLRANFQDESEFEDTLRLADRVNEQLADVSTRGRRPPFVFVDASQLPGAYRLVGRYQIDDDRVKVTVQLSKSSKRQRFTIDGHSSDLEQLARTIAQETQKRLSSR